MIGLKSILKSLIVMAETFKITLPISIFFPHPKYFCRHVFMESKVCMGLALVHDEFKYYVFVIHVCYDVIYGGHDIRPWILRTSICHKSESVSTPLNFSKTFFTCGLLSNNLKIKMDKVVLTKLFIILKLLFIAGN